MNENDIREILEEKIKNAGYYTTEKPPQLYPQKAKAYSLLEDVRAELKSIALSIESHAQKERNGDKDFEAMKFWFKKIMLLHKKVSEHFS